MNKVYLQRSLTAALTGLLFSATVAAQDVNMDIVRQVAPANGWAAMAGGTQGGASASAQHIYRVSTVDELQSALHKSGQQAKIILVEKRIDLSGGIPFKSFADQKKRSQIHISSNTTLLGVGADAGFFNGSLILKKVKNVIIRNVNIETPIDVAPHFEKGDGWNAEWDGMNIIGSEHIWIDHVTLTDGSFTDHMYGQKDGWKYVQHDGELDIKRGSDYISISNSLFEKHDKVMLIGHSDKNGAQDRGKLRITLNDNVFNQLVQRTPRVRFGQIHAYNNLFIGSKANDEEYRYGYSFGLGIEGTVLSENNVFNIDHLNTQCGVFKAMSKGKPGVLVDNGSKFNGEPLNLTACGLQAKNISVPYKYQLQPTDSLITLKNSAGAGKLALN